MDRNKYSRIAHGELPFWNPISVPHIDSYVAQLTLREGDRVIDIGCGRARLLHLLISRFGVRGIGVDASDEALAIARREFASDVESGRMQLLHREFRVTDFTPSTFRFVICIGATHAAQGFRNTLQAAKRLLTPDGYMLVGEGFWSSVPTAEYLAFLGMTADELTTHDGNLDVATHEGFDVVAHSICGLEEWDAYENQYASNVEEYCRINFADADVESMRSKSRQWHDAYHRWGRDTLGFGLYLLQNVLKNTPAER